MKSIATTPLALAISGLMLAASIGSAYADPGIGETVTVTSPRQLSAAEESAISSAAVKTLNHIAAARAALHQHDGVRAREALRQANTLLDIIEAKKKKRKARPSRPKAEEPAGNVVSIMDALKASLAKGRRT